MCGIVATRQHEAVQQLSYRHSVAFLQVSAGPVNIRSVGADGNEHLLIYFEPLHELENDEARHDLGEAGTLALLSLKLSKEKSVGLLVID